MTVTERLAESLVQASQTTLSDALGDKLRLHLFDTIGAMLAGLPLRETTELTEVAAALDGRAGATAERGLKGPLGPTILHLCAATRATEVDDIHLAACVTPSSIIVPSALASVAHIPEATGLDLLKACLVGYEAIIRLGLAIDGPGILYKGIWPTYICASVGSAATVATLLKLPPAQMAHALAIAASMAAGANARSDSPCSKWLMAGAAAQSGALAAFSAKRGFQGDLGLLGERWAKLFGIDLDAGRLTAPPPNHWHVEDIAMKAWCGARQAMAALAGFKGLLSEQKLDAASLREIRVEVPGAYLQMIDRPGPPNSRQESFANLRYLFGLAAFTPDGLYDVARENLRLDGRFAALAKIVHISPSEALAKHYPRHWPAKVSVTDGQGKAHTVEILHAPGDGENPLGWSGVGEKFSRVTARDQKSVDGIAAACRAVTTPSGLRTLLALVEREIQAAQKAGAQ